MAITLWIEPDLLQPIPANRPIYWELRPDTADVIETNGGGAYVEIIWLASPTAPANGTEFTIWGHVFTVQSGTAYTANSFRVVNGNMEQTRDNFRNMILANFFFTRETVVNYSGEGNNTLTIVWDSCREYENFGAEGMDLAAIETIGALVTVQNGSSPVLIDGHKIITAIHRYDPFTDTTERITAQEGVDTVAACFFAYSLNVDYQQQIADVLYTNLPELATDSFDVPGYTTMYQYFQLEYGWIYRENCVPISGDFLKSDIIRVWNAMLDDSDSYGIRKYYPGATGGLPPGQTYVKFLTNAPQSGHYLPLNSFAWMWFFVNKDVQTYDSLSGTIVATINTGFSYAYNFAVTDILGDDGVICVNVSPMIAVDETDATEANIVSYTFQMWKIGGGGGPITEKWTFYIDRECPETTDVYFRNRLGGIDTLPVVLTEEITAQTGNELNFQRSPLSTLVERMTLRGRALVNSVNQRRFSIRAKQNWSTEYQNFFEAFRLSTVRHIKVLGDDGEYYAKKIVIDPGNITIRKVGESIELEATGYFSHDISAQSIAELQVI